MQVKKQVLALVGTVVMLGSTLSCTEKEKEVQADADPAAAQNDPSVNPPDVLPGAFLVQVDRALGSAFTSLSAEDYGLTKIDLANICDEYGGLKEELQNGENAARLKWLCQFSVVNEWLSTARAALLRVKSVFCAADKATSGVWAYDSVEVTANLPVDTDCYTEAYATDFGYVHETGTFPASLTSYSPVPETIADSSKWDRAVKIKFDDEYEVKVYTLLLQQQGNITAVSVLDDNGDESEQEPAIFALSLETPEESEDSITLRYESRYIHDRAGSRHIRLMFDGDYTDSAGFSSMTTASGIFTDYYTLESRWCSDCGPERQAFVRTFDYNFRGFLSREYKGALDNVAYLRDEWSGEGALPESMRFDKESDDRIFFISTPTGPYTESREWHLKNGPLAFESVTFAE